MGRGGHFWGYNSGVKLLWGLGGVSACIGAWKEGLLGEAVLELPGLGEADGAFKLWGGLDV